MWLSVVTACFSKDSRTILGLHKLRREDERHDRLSVQVVRIPGSLYLNKFMFRERRDNQLNRQRSDHCSGG